LDAVQKLGYKFAGKNPINSIGVILYGKPKHFKNENGKFSYLGLLSTKAIDASESVDATAKPGSRTLKR
jgi:hypothetical protein